MNWDALGAIAELLGGLGVILTLFYLALQIRASNLVASAQSRQSMSGFAMSITGFHAQHADRYARIREGGDLSAGDEEFLYWSHMQMLTYGEAHFHQYKLGLMPQSHWDGFANWLESYTRSRGFRECWEKESASFSADFSKEIDERVRSADPS